MHCLAQPTEILGTVTEKSNGKPIPYANIFFAGTYIGTTTDINGYYSLTTSKPGNIIEISAIGFIKQMRPVVIGQKNNIDFALEEEVFNIKEVEVTPGENPAIPLFRKIIDNKETNEPKGLPSWQSRIYAKTEIDVKNVKSSLRNKKLLSQFDFVFDYIDSLEIKGKTFLPVFFNETVSNYYHDSESGKDREEIIANQGSGMTVDMYSQFTGKMYEDINIYDNYITLSDIGFISPLNNLGLQFYKYYLRDSVLNGESKIYEISFHPKLPQEPVFKGKFWVEDGSYAISKLEMQLSEKANVNFVNNLQYSVEFQKTEGRWTPRNESVIADVDIQKNKDSEKLGIIVRKTNIYDDFRFGEVSEMIEKFKEPIIVARNVMDKTDQYWDEIRPVELQQREKNIYFMVDSIKNVRLYHTVAEYVYMFYYGYRDLGKVELGPYYYLYSHNLPEGSRFRLGARTTYKFDKNLRLNVYSAYGTKDRKFKYGGGFEYYFSVKPLSLVAFQMQHDLEMLGKSSNAFNEENIMTTLLSKRVNSKFNMVDKYEFTAQKEWKQGLINEMSVSIQKISGSPNVPFVSQDGNIVPSVRSTELHLGLRYAPGEDIIQDNFERNSYANYDPTFTLNITKGFKGIFGGDYNFLSLNAGLSDKLVLNPVGYSNYYIQIGKIWGEVPFPFLKIHEGNETYAFDINAFNLMNYQEFVSDTYASIFWDHHFTGFFLNKIPLFRKLKWREIIGAKVLWGSYNIEKHNNINLPGNMKGLEKQPYTEFSVGLENIFKIIRVDGVWRFNYNRQSDNQFGLFILLQLSL